MDACISYVVECWNGLLTLKRYLNIIYNFNPFQLWHCFSIFRGYIWNWKRIWAFPFGNMWSLYRYWSKDGFQDADMLNLWWQGSSYENWANTFWLVFTGTWGTLCTWSLVMKSVPFLVFSPILKIEMNWAFLSHDFLIALAFWAYLWFMMS